MTMKEEYDVATAPGSDGSDAEVEGSTKKRKKKASKEKKHKSSKKKKRVDDDNRNVDDAPTEGAEEEANEKHTLKEEKKLARKKRKLELQSQLPTHDADGIPYSKIQKRRMLRRIKHGLHPIPTPEEENEIRLREKRERAEEELLYAEGKHEEDVDEGAGDDDDEEVEGDDEDDEIVKEEEDDTFETKNEDNNNTSTTTEPSTLATKKHHNPPSKGTKRNKPVPPDYICMACQNKPPNDNNTAEFTPHWIYDCPLKQTKKGCNAKSKKLRGLHDPPERKVFVSGLPFDCDEGSVKRFFDDGMASSGEGIGELVHVKLLKFEDSKRCKGQAFLTFDTDEGALLAIKSMNGSVWKDVDDPGMSSSKMNKKKKKKGGKNDMDGEEKKKELRLKVTKVLNRFVTKKKKGGK